MLLNFFPYDFHDFVLKSIRDKTTTEQILRIISTDENYLKASNPVAMYIDSRTFIRDKILYIPPTSSATQQILIPPDLYFRANKSFLSSATKIDYSEATDKMIEELRKELNDYQMDLSKLYSFKTKQPE